MAGVARWQLSYAQRARLLRDRVRGPVPFNVTASFDVAGTIEPDTLAGALRSLADTHPVLRAQLSADGDGMVVLPAVEADLLVRTGLHGAEVEAVIAAYADRLPDRTRAPLWSCQLLTRVDGSQVLAFSFDHLVMDGTSLAIFLADLTTGAAAPANPRSPDSYGSFAADQHARFGGGAAGLAYWHEHLGGTALNRPVVPGFCLDPTGPLSGRRRAVAVELDASERALLIAGAARQRVTVFLAYLAAVAGALAEVSGEDDITVRVLTGGRRPPYTRTVGWFANLVLLRLTGVAAPEHGTVVAGVRATWARQLPHQGVPYPLVLEHVEPARTITDHRPSVVTVNAFTEGVAAGFGAARLVGRPDPGGVAEEPGLHFVLGQLAGSARIECWHDPVRYAAGDVAALLERVKSRMVG